MRRGPPSWGLQEANLLHRRAFITLAVSASLLVGVAAPAHADAKVMKKKSFSAPKGARGSVTWYTDRSGGKVSNWLTVTADDSPGGTCTETWWDYSTRPWQHFNPGVVVNCSGESKTLSKLHFTNYHGIAGVGVIVCSVPNTNGRITRNKSNCGGNMGSMYLWSGRSYSQFATNGIQRPNGITFHRV
jgi:hypothetical protein